MSNVFDELTKELRNELVMPPDEVPDGWYSARQLEQIWGRSQAQTQRMIRVAIELGKMEGPRTFRLRCVHGPVRAVPHYLIKKKVDTKTRRV